MYFVSSYLNCFRSSEKSSAKLPAPAPPPVQPPAPAPAPPPQAPAPAPAPAPAIPTGPLLDDSNSTIVLITFYDEADRYKIRIPGFHVTLKQFKEFLPKKGRYRYAIFTFSICLNCLHIFKICNIFCV